MPCRPAWAATITSAARPDVRWVCPELVAEVRFQAWTADGLFRQASFQGLREDKPASEIVEERPAHQLSGLRKSPGVLALRKVRASSPDRQVLDRPRPTKGDVACYYDSMADWILPQVAKSPAQRHPLSRASRRGLLLPAQLAAGMPDRLVFDLGPAEDVPFKQVVAAAHELRERLQALGLTSFPRTTGGKGLHRMVPIERRHDWSDAKAFAGGIGRAMSTDSPGRYTASLVKAACRGRIFIDYLRNDRAATTVATPPSWDEIRPKLDPLRFTILTVPDLVANRADPWGHYRTVLSAPSLRCHGSACCLICPSRSPCTGGADSDGVPTDAAAGRDSSNQRRCWLSRPSRHVPTEPLHAVARSRRCARAR